MILIIHNDHPAVENGEKLECRVPGKQRPESGMLLPRLSHEKNQRAAGHGSQGMVDGFYGGKHPPWKIRVSNQVNTGVLRRCRKGNQEIGGKKQPFLTPGNPVVFQNPD